MELETKTIEAALRGDRGSQASLLRELQDVWYRFCLGITGNAEDARDAVQETAMRFLRDLGSFRRSSSISTWSLGIALNVCREQRRKRRPTEELEPSQRPSAADGPDESAAQTESRRLLRTTLDELPQRQREAVVLRYFERLSIEETAAAMDCATGTVKATVHQALQSLREKLKAMA